MAEKASEEKASLDDLVLAVRNQDQEAGVLLHKYLNKTPKIPQINAEVQMLEEGYTTNIIELKQRLFTLVQVFGREYRHDEALQNIINNYFDDLRADKDRKGKCYIILEGKLCYAMEYALRSFPEFRNAKTNVKKLEFIRAMLKNEEMIHKFRQALPYSINSRLTDPKGVLAPRQRNSVVYALEFYVKKKKLGEINLTETVNTKVWPLECGKEIFYRLLDQRMDFYVINEHIQLSNYKIKNAVLAIFKERVTAATEAYYSDQLKLNTEQRKNIYLLAAITGNDPSRLPMRGTSKKENIYSQLDILENIKENAGLNERELQILNVWWFSNKINNSLKEMMFEKDLDLVSNIKGRIRVTAMKMYREHFEHDVSAEVIASIQKEEDQRIREDKKLLVDNKFRLRLAYRLEKSARDAGMDMDLFYAATAFSRSKKPAYVSGYIFRLFNSKRDMFEFAFQRKFPDKTNLPQP
jgi:hypothetical protein